MNRFTCLSMIFVALSIGVADAQNYNVRHDFDLRLNARPNQTYRGAWAWSTGARANSRVDGVDVDSNFGSYGWVPPANDFQVAVAVRTGAVAVATSQFNALANGTGFHQVTGFANAIGPNGISARAVSTSTLGLNIGTINRRGRIVWRPDWFVDSISGGTSRAFDPMDFSLLDLDNGNILNSRLWDTAIDFFGGGVSQWTGGDLNINGANGSFFLTMDSPYITSGTGRMSLTFANGLITASDDEGIFDGLLPAVGASSMGFNIPIGDASGDVNIDFDFGPDNTNGFDFSVGFGAGGEAFVTPEPGTLIALGAGALVLWRRRRKR